MELVTEFRERVQQMPTLAVEQAANRDAIEDIALELSIPSQGFASPTVQRLVIGFGREDAQVSIPLALFRSTSA
jgi:hypothetical protein